MYQLVVMSNRCTSWLSWQQLFQTSNFQLYIKWSINNKPPSSSSRVLVSLSFSLSICQSPSNRCNYLALHIPVVVEAFLIQQDSFVASQFFSFFFRFSILCEATDDVITFLPNRKLLLLFAAAVVVVVVNHLQIFRKFQLLINSLTSDDPLFSPHISL